MKRTAVSVERLIEIRAVLEGLDQRSRSLALRLLPESELPGVREHFRDILSREDLGLIWSEWPRLNKQCTLRDYERERKRQVFRAGALITEIVTLTAAEWIEFTDNLMADRDWLKGKGGHGSTAKVGENTESFWQMSQDEQEEWKRQSYVLAIEVRGPDGVILVNPEGYDYARYVGFPLPTIQASTASPEAATAPAA